MAYYMIGIGGTGAKCIESLIHLAAAGMMPDGEMHILFVDPDTSNGSRARVEETSTNYVECKSVLELGQTDLLKTKIVRSDPILWSPFEIAKPDLDGFFHYASFQHSPAGKLFDILYSTKEKETSLEEGFRGHPSIGSAVMAKTVDLQKDPTWSEFRRKIANDDTEAKVFLAGSIFGGTGASGFPTIAQIVKEKLDVKLGGALVLPYFKFDDDNDDKLKARSEEFLMNTQAALKHYHLLNQTDIYDAVYIFGGESRADVQNALGGREQKNAPHFIELYAALAAVHFFKESFDDSKGSQYFLTARGDNNRCGWSDLPDGDNGDTVCSKIGQLARFALAYLSVYKPALQDLARASGKAYRAPWYVDFFERDSVQIDQRLLENLEKYCKDFLLWLANIQDNCSEMESIEFIDFSGYAEKKTDGSLNLKQSQSFSNNWTHLIRSGTAIGVNSSDKLWRRMCTKPGKILDSQGIGKFLHVLYKNCGK